MGLARTLEPEVMDTEEEARDYDAMDHAEVNACFCDDLLSMQPAVDHVLDVGTGTALIPIELCRRAASARVLAIDLATHMLALARENVKRAGLTERISLVFADAKAPPWSAPAFDCIISNSIVHHIPHPEDALGTMWRLLRPGGLLFVRDLARPETADQVRALSAKHARIPERSPATLLPMYERQRALFEASLRASLTVAELRALVRPLGIPEGTVRMTSDRHWTLACVRPSED